MMAAELDPLHMLAQLIGGTVHGDQISTSAGLVYIGCTGKVRIDLRGHILDLGTFSGGPVALADAYRALVAERGAA